MKMKQIYKYSIEKGNNRIEVIETTATIEEFNELWDEFMDKVDKWELDDLKGMQKLDDGKHRELIADEKDKFKEEIRSFNHLQLFKRFTDAKNIYFIY